MSLVEWLEMEDLIRLDYNKKSWIPLCALQTLKKEGEHGFIGFNEEFFTCTSVLFPINKKDAALKCDWGEVYKYNDNKPFADKDQYFRSNRFFSNRKNIEGEYLVLQQNFDTGDIREWYLSEDLILALGLKREDDVWYRPEEDYVDVVRLRRNDKMEPILIEIKTEYLKDYLCARKSGILNYFYQSRVVIIEDRKTIEWQEDYLKKNANWGKWDGNISEIVEGGYPFGAKVHVMHAERTDVDFEEDVPVKKGFPAEDEMKTKSWDFEYKGKKLFRIAGEIWKKTWINPAKNSPRVRDDEEKSKIEFIIDAEGSKKVLANMGLESRWIWFVPDIVNEILKRRNSILIWYTEDTGKVGTSKLNSVHFGMNEIGLVTVYAKDIGELPNHQQKIWSAFNTTPDGKVSKELLMSQMSAKPASTIAPEKKLFDIMKICDSEFAKYYGVKLFTKHDILNDYWIKIHRFKCTNQEGLFLLCKDLHRFVVERIDLNTLKKIRSDFPKDLGSIKRIEKLIIELGYDGRKVTAPLVGVNELRQADAHLPSINYENSFSLAEIDLSHPFSIIGKKLINTLAERLIFFAQVLYKKNTN